MKMYSDSEGFATFPLELEAIYATAPIGLCVLDAQLRFVRINQHLAELNGFSVEAHIGRSVREILPKLADMVEPQLQEVIDTGEPRLNIELTAETAAQPGILRTWLEQWLPLKNEQGDVVGINIVAEEITERKRLESRSQLLQQFSFELSAAITSAQVVELIIRTAIQISGAGFSAVFGLSDDGQALERLESVGLDEVTRHKYARLLLADSYPITDAIRSKKNLLIESAEAFIHAYPQLEELAKRLNIQGIICFPFYGEKGVTGGMHVTFTQPRKIDQEELNFLILLAQTCGQAIERARQYEETRRAADRVERLQTVTAALAQTVTQNDVARVTVEQTSKVLGAISAHFSIFHHEENAFARLHTSAQISAEDLVRWRRYPAHPGYPATAALKSQKPLWFTSPAEQIAQFPVLAEYSSVHPGAAALIPLISNEQVIAVLWLAFAEERLFSDNDKSLVLAIAQQCSQALERAKLAEQTKHTATLEERQRLARELHDAVSQSLTAATVLAETAPRLWEIDPQKAMNAVTQVLHLNRTAQAELRTLLWELRPDAILKTKQSDLLHQLVQVIDGRKGIKAHLTVDGEDESLPEAVHVALYRITQESLNNTLKHSEAKQVIIQLTQKPDSFTLRIMDDGRGFDSTQISGGLGMGTMRERANEIGAVLSIISQAGQGTQVELLWSKSPSSS